MAEKVNCASLVCSCAMATDGERKLLLSISLIVVGSTIEESRYGLARGTQNPSAFLCRVVLLLSVSLSLCHLALLVT